MKNFKKYFSHVIVLLVIFSMILPNYSWAKREKPGAHIIVLKIDKTVSEGELLVVKEDSLLVLPAAGGSGETINIDEIMKIKIRNKSNFLIGAAVGFCVGAILGGRSLNNNNDLDGNADVLLTPLYGLGGFLVGGMVGRNSKSYKSIVLKNSSEIRVKRSIKYLKTKARFKN